MATEQDWAAYTDQAFVSISDTLLVRTSAGAGAEVAGTHIAARRGSNKPIEAVAGVTVNNPSLGVDAGAFFMSGLDDKYGLMGGVTVSTGNTWLQAMRRDGTATGYDISLQQAGGGVIVGAAARTITTARSEYVVTSAGTFPLALLGVDRGLLVRASAASGFYLFFENSGGTNNGSISHSGSTTTYNTTSDARIKDNIADAPDASDLIDAIQVRSWDFKADGSHWRFGMVAQELLEVVPEAVSVPVDDDMMMGVDYSKLVPLLIKEVQALRGRVAALEAAL